MSQGKYEKAEEIILEEHLTHIVKKRPATRNAYRIVGLIFIALGVWLIYMAFNGSGMRMLKLLLEYVPYCMAVHYLQGPSDRQHIPPPMYFLMMVYT